MIYFAGNSICQLIIIQRGFSLDLQDNTEATENAIYLATLTTLRHNKLQSCTALGGRGVRGSLHCGLWIALQIRINFAAKLRNKSFVGTAFIIWEDAHPLQKFNLNCEDSVGECKDMLLMRFVNWLLNDSRCIIVY